MADVELTEYFFVRTVVLKGEKLCVAVFQSEEKCLCSQNRCQKIKKQLRKCNRTIVT